MKTTLALLAAAVLMAPAAIAQPESAFRLFLSEEGVEGNAPLKGLAPALVNPVVATGGGPVRLFVWGQVTGTCTPQKFIGVGYNVRTTGSARVIDARTWNYSNILNRWTVTNGGQIGGGELVNVRLAANPIGFFAVADNAGPGGFDLQFDPATQSTVLGWIEVDGVGDLFLEFGDVGVVVSGCSGDCELYLGFGDEWWPLTCRKSQGRSPFPEATLVEVEILGDLNCDSLFNGGDIDPFFLALADPVLYQQVFPNCDRDHADMNGDGQVNGADIDVFFECLGAGGCP